MERTKKPGAQWALSGFFCYLKGLPRLPAVLIGVAAVCLAPEAGAYYNLAAFWHPQCRELDSSWAPEWASLVGYWNFNGTGPIANGAPIWPLVGTIGTASNANGTGLTYAKGKENQGITFDGVDDQINLSLPIIDTTAGDVVTVAFWVKWNGSYMSGWSAPFAFTHYNMAFESSGTGFGFNTGNGDLWGISSAGFANQWIHVVAEFYNGTTTNSVLYINGVQKTPSQITGSAQNYSVDSNIWIGNHGAAPVYNFGGSMDDVAIWNKALTSAEVAQLYNNQINCHGVPTPPSLAFTTASQTVNAGTCSTVVTVTHENSAGTAANVSSNTPVTLSGDGFTFYSDVTCATQVYNVTIANGTPSKNFYFKSTGAQNVITGLANGLSQARQIETINSGTAISGYRYLNPSYGSYGGDSGVSFNPSGSSPVMLSYNGSLFMGYSYLWNSGAFVAMYNGTTWADSNGGTLSTPNSISFGSPYEGDAPLLAVANGILYATWVESNGTNSVVRVAQYNGSTTCSGSYWCPADQGYINVSNADDAGNPYLATYNGNLYIAWDENNNVHVAAYHPSSTSWTRIDDNGHDGTNGTAMNYNINYAALEPSLFGSSSGLIASWAEGNETNELHVKVFNGTSWSAGDGGSGIQYQWISQWEQGNLGSFASLNDKVYIAWEDYTNSTSVHVSVYGGGANWTPVDGGTENGLTIGGDSNPPTLFSFQGSLYAMWTESDNAPPISYQAHQTRLAKYNGNDSAPSWTIVLGPGTDGMEYVPWNDTNSQQPAMGVLNNKLYAAFGDVEYLDTAVFTQGTSAAELWLPNMINNGNDSGVYHTAGCAADEVRSADTNGYVANLGATAEVVTLSGTGVSFFQDDFCMMPLTSNQVTIPAYDNGAHFFFRISGTTSTFTITATSTSGPALTAGTQNLSSPNDDFWLGNSGAGCDGNWSTGACWSQGGSPGWAQTAIFNDNYCTASPAPACNVTIDSGAPSNLNGTGNIFMESNYTGTITVGSGSGFSPAIFGILQIQSGTFAVGANTFETGTVYLQGGSLTSGSGTLTVDDDWVNLGGTFTPGTGTVAFNSGNDHHVKNSTTFYNLTEDDSSGASNNNPDDMYFEAGTTQTVTHTTTFKGNTNWHLRLLSETPGTQWSINPQGTRAFAYLMVQDSDNTNATGIDPGLGWVNNGNNTNWTFTLATPAYVQSNKNSCTTAVNSCAATFTTANNTAGNSIVVGFKLPGTCGSLNGVSITDNDSNTYSYDQNESLSTSGYCVGLAHADNISVSPNAKATITVSFSGTAGTVELIEAEYSGLVINSYDQSNVNNTSGTSVTSTSTDTTTVTNEMLIGVVGLNETHAETATGTGGFTVRQTANGSSKPALALEDKSVTSTGAYAATCTLTNSEEYGAIIGTYEANGI